VSTDTAGRARFVRDITGTAEKQHRCGGPLRLAWRELTEDAAEVCRSRHVLYYLIVTQLKIRYQRSVLGIFWAVLNPALNLVILAVVFNHVLGRGIPNYHIYLFTGLLPFMMISEVLNLGSKCLLTSQAFLQQSDTPILLFPLRSVGVALVNFLCALIAMGGILVFTGVKLGAPLLILPVALAALGVFCLGITLISMTLVTYYRDFEHIVNVMLRGLYFMSPIILAPEHLGPFSFVMKANPITYVIRPFRHVLYAGTWPTGQEWALLAAVTLVPLIVGYAVFKRYEHDYVFRL
jgi:ABC-2 type transport system permease protein/lipopolysaccharide transport system permease protein